MAVESVERSSLDTAAVAWHALSPSAVAGELQADLEHGLSTEEAEARLKRYGLNVLQQEAKASMWAVALQQVRDPMNIMLIVVTIASLAIGELLDGGDRRPARHCSTSSWAPARS